MILIYIYENLVSVFFETLKLTIKDTTSRNDFHLGEIVKELERL